MVVNYSRSADAAEEKVAQIENLGGRAVAVRADVTDESQVRELVQRAVHSVEMVCLTIAWALSYFWLLQGGVTSRGRLSRSMVVCKSQIPDGGDYELTRTNSR
jgi:NAD(P)-dependent dehydrogenase (short-subunit alcohol dehydrogenase family)